MSAPAMNPAEMQAEIERLRADNAKLAAAATTTVKPTIRVAEKGGISVYGLGRFPQTMYAEQWERLFTIVDDVKAFIASNPTGMKRKGDSVTS